MNEGVFTLLDQLHDRAAPPVPRRDRYRASYHEPWHDRVEDDEQHGQDATLDSSDERLMQQPYDHRQRQAAKGQAQLGLAPAPQSPTFFAASVSSQPQPSYHAHAGATYDLGRQQTLLEERPQLAQYAHNAAQPQGSSSDTQLGAPSSPAFLASQRRGESASFSATQSGGWPYAYEEKASFINRQIPRQATRARPQASFTRSAPSPVPQSQVPVCQGIPLVLTSELPDRLRTIFPYPNFNAIQSKCFDSVYRSNNNFVLASPTGSGKTVVLELAVCRAIATNATGQYKIVYQAPTKALCSERQRDWQAKFGQVGLNCVELTGDTDAADLRNVQSANVIITTPEKWDSITRKWKDHEKLMRLIKLLLIDEVHILKEDRGATLEAIVSRMKSIATDVRFVALSATVPNVGDVATWLGKNSAEAYEPAANESFGEEFRPVKLRKHVCGYQFNSSNDFAFEKFLDGQLPEIIHKYSEKKPIMVFCCTRNSTVATAKMLANWWTKQHLRDRAWRASPKLAPFRNRDLRDCTASGVAFHHAGIEIDDRVAVERAFLKGEISVICCTSTLAVGVNLPCHLVVIKNTVTFTRDMLQEYADIEVMQMLGRAGRPQFDDSGIAVIMTRQSKVAKYEKMVTGQSVLESTLHLNLIDHMNAEISLGTIRDLPTARRWLTSTFLYVRLKQNPVYYKLDGARSGQSVDEQLDDICFRDINLLRDNNLIMGQEYLRCTEFGHAMARYYVHFYSMRIVMGLQPKASISEILSAIAQASEFESIRFRAGEKSLYKVINRSPYIRFPIPVNLDLPAHKVSLLVQSVLGAADVTWDDDLSKHRAQYNMEVIVVFKHITRLVRCIIDCQICLGDSVSINNALMLERSLTARVWDDSPLQMRQIEGIGVVGVRKLANVGIRSIEELDCTEAHRIESSLGRNPPFGMSILEKLKSFPKLRVSLHALSSSVMKTPEGVKVEVKADIGFINEKTPEYFNSRAVFVCLLAETSDGHKIHFARISAKKLGSGQVLVFPALLTAPNLSINCYIMCDGIAGTTRSASVTPKFAPSMFPIPKSLEPPTLRVPERPTSNMSRRRIESAMSTWKTLATTDEFGDDDIDDDELLKASFRDLDFDHIDNYANPTDNITRKNTAKSALSKDKSARAEPTVHRPDLVEQEPRQLDNGKWACNHSCKDKQACRHMCCKDGMDKPPKKTGAKRVLSNEIPSQFAGKRLEDRENKTQTKLQLGASKRKCSVAIEELDLTRQDKRKKANYAINGPKDYENLHKLHKSIRKKDPPSCISFAMHQKPGYCYDKDGYPHLSFLGIDSDTVRPGSISSDYRDVHFEDMTCELQQVDPSRAPSMASKNQNDLALDNGGQSSSNHIAQDRLSETFGDDESLFEDVMIGMADSEELQVAGQGSDDRVHELEYPLHADYAFGLEDEDFVGAGSTNPANNQLSTPPLGFPTSSVVNVPSIPPEKGHALFFNDTSNPHPANSCVKPAKTMPKGLVQGELRQPKNGTHEKPTVYKEEGIEPKDQPIPEAYEDLEPWLFKEFGDIVELID